MSVIDVLKRHRISYSLSIIRGVVSKAFYLSCSVLNYVRIKDVGKKPSI